MKTIVIALMILATCPTFARQDQTQPPAQDVAFFDVLDLPARIDGPKLKRNVLKCVLANRSGEQLVGLRLALMLVDSSSGRMSRLAWNEEAEVPAYSIKSFEFHPPIKGEIREAKLFLAIDEVIGRDTVWRTVDADRLLRAYARGDHSLDPKVQKLQNKFDDTRPPVIRSLPRKP
jgi:hypothetical protein